MRLWKNENGALITDEQVLRHIASFGSMSAALENGDIELLENSSSIQPTPRKASQPHRTLSDYLD